MANSNRRTNRGGNDRLGAPRWVVFMGGVAAGVIATVVSGALIWPRAVVPTSPLASNAALGESRQHNDDIEYEFDPMLRASEVPVPAGDAPVSVVIDATAPVRVLLQAGAFRTRADAENLRASLLLLDLGPVNTREALMKNGEVWFRVFVGPFANDAAQRSAKDKLVTQNISPLIVAAPADMPNAMPSVAQPKPGTPTAPAPNAPTAATPNPAAPNSAASNPPAPTPATAKPTPAAPRVTTSVAATPVAASSGATTPVRRPAAPTARPAAPADPASEAGVASSRTP